MAYEFRGRTQARTEEESGRRRPARAQTAREGRPAGDRRTAMQTFAAIMGLVFLLAGVAGFIPGITTNYDQLRLAGPESDARLLGIFQVSILHNIVHLLFGVGLVAAARYSWSKLYLLGGGVVYLVVTLYGSVIDRASDANFLPINNADNLLHLVLGLALLALGLLGLRLAKGDAVAR